MIINIVFNILGVLLFLFLFWRRLREDYVTNQIHSTAFLIILFVFLSNQITRNYFPDWWFWISFLVAIFGLALGIFRYGLKFFETADAMVISFLPWLGLNFLSHSIENSDFISLIASLIVLVLILVYFLFDMHYKKLSWYKSGRVGFAGLTVLGISFLIRAAVAIKFPAVISFSSNYEPLLSGMVAFISFLLVFNLAQQKT